MTKTGTSGCPPNGVNLTTSNPALLQEISGFHQERAPHLRRRATPDLNIGGDLTSQMSAGEKGQFSDAVADASLANACPGYGRVGTHRSDVRMGATVLAHHEIKASVGAHGEPTPKEGRVTRGGSVPKEGDAFRLINPNARG